jgi:hypothetical protein
MKTTSLWEDPTLFCVYHVFENLSDVLETLVERHFGPSEDLKSYIRLVVFFVRLKNLNNIVIREIVINEAEKCEQSTLKAVRKTLERERGSLFTQNIEFFISEKTKWLKRYEYAHQYPTSTLSFTMTASYDPPATPFREPLILMAEVRAYFEVAYRVRYVLEQCRCVMWL